MEAPDMGVPALSVILPEREPVPGPGPGSKCSAGPEFPVGNACAGMESERCAGRESDGKGAATPLRDVKSDRKKPIRSKDRFIFGARVQI